MATGSEIASLLNGKDALVLFFGVYFTLVMNLIRKYRTFDVQLLFSKDKDKRTLFQRRFIIGFLVIDVLPIIWFLILYTAVIPNRAGPFPIMGAAFAALSVLGFVKILHSIIATENYSKYYTKEEFQYVVSEWGRKNDTDNTFKAHFIPGFFYLIIFPALAYIVANLPF
jgi:hypothetical protein